jgi:hypothetical protein
MRGRDSDRFSQRVRRSLQTLTDLGEFSRREVNALLLGVCTLLLAVGTRAKGVQLGRHAFDGASEVGQLASHHRCVLFGRHCFPKFKRPCVKCEAAISILKGPLMQLMTRIEDSRRLKNHVSANRKLALRTLFALALLPRVPEGRVGVFWGFGRNSGCRASRDHHTPQFVICVASCFLG